jgi:dipeptidyl aminopeptidase/acylaminoacyl peptidase
MMSLLMAALSVAQTPAPSSRTLPSWAKPAEQIILPPEFSVTAPDGSRAGWVAEADGSRAGWVAEDRKSILSATRARGGDWASADRLLTTRGRIGKMVFSPDGQSLAYENERTWRDDGNDNDKWQFICVFSIKDGGRITYIDPSFDMDSDPQWSADGTSISFTRKVAGMPDLHLTKPVERSQRRLGFAPQASEEFTMADILATPFIFPPVSSGDGRALAYSTREAEDRDIYFVRIGGSARRIVKYSGDDGIEITDLAVSEAGDALAFVRVGALNKQDDASNPRALPTMPQPQVWIVGVDGDSPRFLGTGSDPMFTLDQRYVWWRSNGSIKAARLTWTRHHLASVGEPEEFMTGKHAGMRISPDGARGAYERGTGIEILDFDSRTAAVIPHGAGLDLGPVWSPDSKQLVFRREPVDSPEVEHNLCGGGVRYCGPMLASQPWSIWVVNVADLNPRKIWQADPGIGSVFYALDQSLSPSQHGDQLFWSANDQIAFVWEKDGWRHLYAVPVSGGAARLLTPGEGEVETAALALNRRELIYATNIGDLGRRHLSAVSFDGRSAKTITSGDTDEWAPTPLSGGAIAYITAGWNAPPQIASRSVSGTTHKDHLPQARHSFPRAFLVKPRLIEFPGADNKMAFGQLFVPSRPKGCAIVFSHGGIRRQMLPGFHYMDAYQYLYGMNQYLASRGCVVLSVEYRSSIMRGEAFRDAEGWGFAGNSEIQDFVGAAKYLMAREDVDAKRGVGIYGLSWGGYMTAEALALHSDLFKVGFDMAGVHTAVEPENFQYSSVGHLDTWTSPIFLVQGDDDMNVDFDEGLILARALQSKRPTVEFKQRVLPDHTHGLDQTFDELVDVYSAGSNFLLSHLGVAGAGANHLH